MPISLRRKNSKAKIVYLQEEENSGLILAVKSIMSCKGGGRALGFEQPLQCFITRSIFRLSG